MGTIKSLTFITIIYLLQLFGRQNVQAANMVCFLDTSRVKSGKFIKQPSAKRICYITFNICISLRLFLSATNCF